MLMQELICISAFLYQYIEFFVFLKVFRRGGYSPPSPLPKSATAWVPLSQSWLHMVDKIRSKKADQAAKPGIATVHG